MYGLIMSYRRRLVFTWIHAFFFFSKYISTKKNKIKIHLIDTYLPISPYICVLRILAIEQSYSVVRVLFTIESNLCHIQRDHLSVLVIHIHLYVWWFERINLSLICGIKSNILSVNSIYKNANKFILLW